MKNLTKLIVAGTVLGASAASAGGYNEPAPTPVVVTPAPVTVVANAFEGAYIFGGAAYANTDYDVDGVFDPDTTDDDDSDFISLSGDGSDHGYGFTVGAGYDFAVSPSFIVGAFADYTRLDHETTFGLDDDPDGAEDYDAAFNHESTFTIGGRAGVVAGPSTLIYALAGYSSGEFNSTTSDGTDTADADFTADGYSIGAGVEQMVTENFSVRAEYRYTKFDDFESDWSGDDMAIDMNGDIDTSTVALTAAFRF